MNAPLLAEHEEAPRQQQQQDQVSQHGGGDQDKQPLLAVTSSDPVVNARRRSGGDLRSPWILSRADVQVRGELSPMQQAGYLCISTLELRLLFLLYVTLARMQVLLISCICFCCPGMWNSLTSMAGGIDPQMASQATAALYLCFTLGSLPAPGICNLLGARATVLLGTLGYACHAEHKDKHPNARLALG